MVHVSFAVEDNLGDITSILRKKEFKNLNQVLDRDSFIAFLFV